MDLNTVVRHFANYSASITPKGAILVTYNISDTSDHILIIDIDKTSVMSPVYVGRCNENKRSLPYCIIIY